MPKQKNKSSLLKRVNTFANRHKFLSVFMFLILVIAIWQGIAVTVHYLQVDNEHKQFLQTKADLDDLYAQIVKQVGEPSQHKSVDYCSYTSQEFGRGARSCDIHEYFIYSANLNNLDKKILDILESSNTLVSFHKGNIGGNDTSVYNQNSNYYFNNRFKLNCYVDFWSYNSHDLPLFTDGIKQSTDNGGEYIDLNCGGSAKAEYFPVNQQLTYL